MAVSDLPKIEESMMRNIKDNGAEAGFSGPRTPHVVFILKSVKLSPPCTDSIWNTTDKFLLRTKERRRSPRSSASVTTERQIKVCMWLRETSSYSCLDWIRAPFCRRHGYGPRASKMAIGKLFSLEYTIYSLVRPRMKLRGIRAVQARNINTKNTELFLKF